MDCDNCSLTWVPVLRMFPLQRSWNADNYLHSATDALRLRIVRCLARKRVEPVCPRKLCELRSVVATVNARDPDGNLTETSEAARGALTGMSSNG